MANHAFPALVCVLLYGSISGQDPIWSPDVANIIYDHCSSCHHEGGIAPFSLMSYSDVVGAGNVIPGAITTRHMPPWPADPEYRHFSNENVLTQAEIDAVVDWINFGAPFGDPGLEPTPPVYQPTGSVLTTIDHVVAIEPYTLQSNNDEYRWFVVENPFSDTVFINKMEVIPGLDAVVHHCDISYDLTGASLANDLLDPLPGFNGQTGSPTYSYYMNAWQPGGDVINYPPGWGIAVPPEADFVLEIHYGPDAIGQVDSTLINMQFTAGQEIRPVRVGWLLGQSAPTLVDGPFQLPANTISTYHQEYTVPTTRSFIGICPHMHLLGKSYKIWYETPGQDSIPLIDIPQWDFHWQRYYYFQSVEVIPAGSVIKSIGVYDNTFQNPYNPNIPPQNVYLGPTTTDEMFLTFFIWANYEPGDEFIVLDSTLFAGVDGPPLEDAGWIAFPDPAIDHINIGPVRDRDLERWQIYDPVGKLVREGRVHGALDAYLTVDLIGLKPSVYRLVLISPNRVTSRAFVKQ
ncbi:MAG: hypothetical protein KDB88_02490 [Flavobacteriales bacterium]|nr:hypothetical protein [Flavobacteriales bacterium]